MENRKKILITGSNGFIGSKLCEYYINKGFEVFGLDIAESIILNKDVEFVKVNLESDDVTDLFKEINPQAIIHCAGSASVGLSVENPELDFSRNVGVLYKTLLALKRAKINSKFIYLSSAAVYGDPDILPISEDSKVKPISPYGLHKKICEEICEYFNYKEDVNTVVVRIFSAYGEGLKKQILWDIYNKLKYKNELHLFGSGNETRDFIHVDDIVKSIDLIVCKDTKHLVYNIANGMEIRIKNLAEEFVEKLGKDKSIVQFNGLIKAGDPINWRADISRIMSLGFKPQISLDKGLSKYADWLGAIKDE